MASLYVGQKIQFDSPYITQGNPVEGVIIELQDWNFRIKLLKRIKFTHRVVLIGEVCWFSSQVIANLKSIK
jgi:hypothetical protein